MRFARGLVTEYDGKRGNKDDSKCVGISTWVSGGPPTETGHCGREDWPPGRGRRSLV